MLDRSIPANTKVFVSVACIHVSPEIWGPDPLTFRPGRWLTDDGTLITPAKGTFLPWSAGPRVCPGLKMAQTEFLAICRGVFSKWKVEAGQLKGETPDMAKSRLQKVLDSSQPRFTLTVKNPREMTLKFVKR
jgi:cytochrome P450